MKNYLWIAAVAVLLMDSASAAEVNPSQLVGKSEAEVKAVAGEPIGRMEMGDELILTYQSVQVTFRDGKAAEAKSFKPTPNAPAPSRPAAQEETGNVESGAPNPEESKPETGNLKFTAVDGTQVDLSQMRGKVVLIDFWATWCGPCVGEVPHVVEAYKKYHDKGFEIIGISLDQDLKKLTDFTQKNGMTWPQYFDGKGWKNKISSANGITGIPAMWLVDKEGHLVTKNARSNLAAQVESLLSK